MTGRDLQRYTDHEGRSGARMTRLRGENDNEDRREQDRRKVRENLIVVLWVVLLIAGAAWLVDAFIKNNREQECYARGGRNCAPIDIPDQR